MSNKDPIRLMIVSGRSGSGKTVALRVLEDLGFYCIDNLPLIFLPQLIEMARQHYPKIAVSVDIRNRPENMESFEGIYRKIKLDAGINSTLIFLDASENVLIKRYSETRRLHPLSRRLLSLDEAIALEEELLSDLAAFADLRINTSTLSIHDLSSEITALVEGSQARRLVMVFESFGFKNGIAQDADFVFDARFLPNPFWEPELRMLSGLTPEVKAFFARYPQVEGYVQQIDQLLLQNLPDIESGSRSYLTTAIGCTGGFHRSVYIAQRLYSNFRERGYLTKIRHRSLEKLQQKKVP